ncbi:MAG: hypothetical protein ACJ71J_00440 [Nitrososphaeraceae archaeon]
MCIITEQGIEKIFWNGTKESALIAISTSDPAIHVFMMVIAGG